MAFFAPQGMDDLFDGAAAEVFGVKTVLFLSFPYVCPEPVLVKRSFLYINGSKRLLLPQPPSTTYKSRSFVKTGSGQT
jgi:hypothetical protein